MKKLLSGTFEQVEDALSESFIRSFISIPFYRWKGWKVTLVTLIFLLMFGGGTYFIYGVGWAVTYYDDEATFYLNPNNEYRFFFSNFRFLWYIHITAFFVLLTVIIIFKYRKKNNIRAFFISQVTLFIFFLLLMIQGFAAFQLFVNNSVLRTIYTILFIVCIIYAFVKGYKNAFAMIYEDKKQRSAIIEWASKHRQAILSVLIAFGGVNYFFKTTNESAQDFEKNLLGALIDYIPIIVSFATLFGLLYGFSVLIRSYYLYKYSEPFRLKFGYEKEEWYGEKYEEAS